MRSVVTGLTVGLVACLPLSSRAGEKPSAPSVKELINDLMSADAEVRRIAAFKLEARTPPPVDAVPALARLVEDPHEEVRFAVFQALRAFGLKGQEAIPALIKAVRNEKFADRVRALDTLGRLTVDDSEVLHLALEAARDRGEPIRAAAFRLLEVFGPGARDALPTLTAALKEGKEVSGHAARALGAMGPDAREALPLLVPMLGRDDDFLVGSAARAIVAISGDDAVPILAKALAEHKHRERSHVIEALATLGPGAKAAVPALAAAMDDDEHFVRLRAAEALAAIGPASLATLVRRAARSDERRDMAADAAASIAGRDPAALNGLLETLETKDATAREAAAFVLGKLGPEAKKAAPRLAALLEDGDRPVAWQAAASLVAIGGAGAVDAKSVDAILPVLVEGLRQKDASRAAAFADAIGRLGPRGRDATTALLAAFLGKDGRLAAAAVEALAAIGARAAVPFMIDSLGAAREAAPMIPLAMITARQFRRLGPDTIAPLTKALGSKNARVRAGAAMALCEFGPEAKAAIPALIRNLKDTDREAALWAGRALVRIDPDEAEAAGVK